MPERQPPALVCELLHGVFPEIAAASISLPATESRLEACKGVQIQGKTVAFEINAYSVY